MNSPRFFGTASFALVLALAGCTDVRSDETNPDIEDPVTTEDPADGYGSIVDVASEAGDFTTLLAAAEAADLATTLDEGGPFTVFAPTDDAFAQLPEGTVDALLADIPTLTDILLYHVVDGTVGAEDVGGMSLVTTLQGTDFRVSTDGGVFINDAEVTVTDIPADNGVIHVIDTVITPPGSIAQIAQDDGRFDTLVAALSAADLVDTLDGDGPFTVFAPTDDAFAKLPAGTIDALLADIPTLTSILLYHVTDEKLVAADVVSSSSVMTLEGSGAEVVIDGGTAYIDGAQITFTDIPASNGVIHVIDSVMLPE